MNVKIFYIIKIILFFLNFKKNSYLFRKSRDIRLVSSAIKMLSILKEIHKNIIKIYEKFANYQNKKI